MGMIEWMIKAIIGYILIVCFFSVGIGSMWVLRIALDWFWDFDYVEWIKGRGKKHEQTR